MVNTTNPFTYDQIKEWEKMRSALYQDRKVLSSKIEALNSLIHTAGTYLSAANAPEGRGLPGLDNESKKEVSLIEAITVVLATSGQPMDHKQIRAGLPDAGFSKDRQTASPNYYYTAINRLIGRKKIEKVEGGKYWIDNNETEGDMFAKTTPSA